MTKLPWMKFYPADWRANPGLRVCCLAARGLSIEMLAVMHEAEPRGHLLLNGRPVTIEQLAVLTGSSVDECSRLLKELETAGVFDRLKNGVIVSRRMERDENLSRKYRANGQKGGNPNLCNKKKKAKSLNPPGKGPDKAKKPEARFQKPESSSLRSDETRAHDQTTSDGQSESELVPDLPSFLDRRKPKGTKAGSDDYPPNAFETWWEQWPNKVGKLAAENAFEKVRKRGDVTFDRLIRGIDDYIRTKPPDRNWCNPATWLNEGRWDDEPAPPLKPNDSGRNSMATIAMEMARETDDGGDLGGKIGEGDGSMLDLAAGEYR
jgi:hypothetical protein